MKNIVEYETKIFDAIKHLDENNREYWLARELMEVLDYKEWRNFYNSIKKALVACEISKNNVKDHFVEVNKMIKLAKGAQRNVKDYKLSRYACYLIVQNGDSSKEVIALGQTYFAIQTRKRN